MQTPDRAALHASTGKLAGGLRIDPAVAAAWDVARGGATPGACPRTGGHETMQQSRHGAPCCTAGAPPPPGGSSKRASSATENRRGAAADPEYLTHKPSALTSHPAQHGLQE